MEFLGISGPEAMIIALVGLIVLGSKGMASVARTLVQARERIHAIRSLFNVEMSHMAEEVIAQADIPEFADSSVAESLQRRVASRIEYAAHLAGLDSSAQATLATPATPLPESTDADGNEVENHRACSASAYKQIREIPA